MVKGRRITAGAIWTSKKKSRGNKPRLSKIDDKNRGIAAGPTGSKVPASKGRLVTAIRKLLAIGGELPFVLAIAGISGTA